MISIMPGSLFIVDEQHFDILKYNLSTNPPPGRGPAVGTLLCCDLDDGDDMLECMFPEHVQKATLLCPPPSALFKEIDGDMDGFISEYMSYLDYDNSVKEFLSSLLLFIHLGGNAIIYTPSNVDDDAIWLNTLMAFFNTRFGITIGTSQTEPYYFDERYSSIVSSYMYENGSMNVFDFINSTTDTAPNNYIISEKLRTDLAPYVDSGHDPAMLFTEMKQHMIQNGVPILYPAIRFE